MAGTLQKIQPLHAELKPPTGAEPTGMITPSGKQVYVLKRRMARSIPDFETPEAEAKWRELNKLYENREISETEYRVQMRQLRDREQRFRKHQVSGERMYGLRKPEIYQQEKMFYLESDGRGNVLMIDWRPPTPEEIAARERQEAIAEMREELAVQMVDAGLTPRDLVQALADRSNRGVGATPAAMPEPDEEEDTVADEAAEPATPVPDPASETWEPDFSEHPIMKGPGTWELSNGDVVGRNAGGDNLSKEQAQELEAQVQAQNLEELRVAAVRAHEHAAQVPEV